MTEPGRAGPTDRDRDRSDLSAILVTLMKGPVYREEREQIWRQLIHLRRRIEDYVAVIGLVPVIDEVKGYAFLRSREDDPDEDAPPRLVHRRELSYPVSLLLALLRRRLAELDASSSESRLVVDREDIVEMIRVFLPAGSNEARVVDQIDAHLKKVKDLGFLRELPNSVGKYEVRRILEAFIDAQWLADFDRRLTEYAETARAEAS